MTGLTWCTAKSSWPGLDPAIHVCRCPQSVDARVKACPPAGEAGPVGTGMTTS